MIASNLVNILFLATVPEILKNSLESIAKKENYISSEIGSQNVNTNGDSYLGEIYKVKIKGKTADGDKETKLFIKKILQNDKIPSQMDLKSFYESELFVYTQLSKIFTQLQEEFEVPLEERFKLVRGYDESTSDYIILEDMSKEFNTYHRMDLVSLKFSELSVKQLAKFHALCFVIQKRMPEYFENKIKRATSWIEKSNKGTERLMRTTVSNIKDNFIKQKAEAFMPIGLTKLTEYGDKNTTNILCLRPGDYRPTNILKKEKNGEVVEVLPVDFQFLHYGCPVLDLVSFLFMGTDSAFRREHLTNLKDLYYTTLVNFSNHFHIDMEKIVPRKVFEDTFKERLDYGLILTMIMFPLDFAPHFELGKQNAVVGLDERFQDRFKGVVEDFIEWGYL